MKVLHLVNAYAPEGPGGVETYARALVAAQSARGDVPIVVAGSGVRAAGCGLSESEVDGVRVLRVARDDLYFDHYAKAWHPDVERLLDGLLARERPDVVHVQHWLRLTSNLVEIADRRGCPAVVTLHDFRASCPRCYRMHRDGNACARELSVASCAPCVPRFGHEPEAEVAESIALYRRDALAELDRARAVLALDPTAADLFCRFTGFPRARVRAIALPYRRHGLARLPAPRADEPLRIAFWGRVAPHKGVGVLVAAFGRALASRPGVAAELHVFGGFSSLGFGEEVERAARGLPIRFHGPFELADIAAVAPHVAAFPSTCIETHGYVLDECFEFGLPSLLSDLGAPAARAAASALTHEAGNVAALAASIGALLDDRRVVARLAAAVPPLPPSFDEHAVELDATYRAAIAARPRAPTFPHPSGLERAAFLLRQRESALARVCPPGGPA